MPPHGDLLLKRFNQIILGLGALMSSLLQLIQLSLQSLYSTIVLLQHELILIVLTSESQNVSLKLGHSTLGMSGHLVGH